MIGRYDYVSRYPQVFPKLTGITCDDFTEIAADLVPLARKQRRERLTRPQRKKAIGGGRQFCMQEQDYLLLTIMWLRIYPTNEVLGYLFGVSDSTVSRTIARWLPLLEQAGRDTMRMPDPGRKHRRELPELLKETPQLAVIIDSFEQRIQRPQNHADADTYYSGKKKAHTLKSQVVVDEATGRIVEVSPSVRGPTADITLLHDSGVLTRLPQGVGAIGDLAYIGIDRLHPQGLGATPRRKPRGHPRPLEDIAYNTAFSRRRIVVEHTIGRLRRFTSLALTDRHHRQHHTRRVCAVAGLVNRRLPYKCPA